MIKTFRAEFWYAYADLVGVYFEKKSTDFNTLGASSCSE